MLEKLRAASVNLNISDSYIKESVVSSFCVLCWEKGPNPIAKQLAKEERERVTREGDKVNFADCRFERRGILNLWEVL